MNGRTHNEGVRALSKIPAGESAKYHELGRQCINPFKGENKSSAESLSHDKETITETRSPQIKETSK